MLPDVLALVIVLVLLVVTLWSVSIGAMLDVRREERRDMSTACPAWVPLARRDGRVYRCGVPLPAGRAWCGTHASPRARIEPGPDVERVDATRQWADARAKMRWGVPVASGALLLVVVVVTVLL